MACALRSFVSRAQQWTRQTPLGENRRQSADSFAVQANSNNPFKPSRLMLALGRTPKRHAISSLLECSLSLVRLTLLMASKYSPEASVQPSPLIISCNKSREAGTATLGCISLCIGLFGYYYGGFLGLDWLVIWAPVNMELV